MKTIPAKITSITDKVIVSGHLLEKPKKEDYKSNYNKRKEVNTRALPEKTEMKLLYKKDRQNYEASAFIAEVENIERENNYWFLNNLRASNCEIILKLNQSCQVTVPVDGKCRIVSL